MTDVTGVGIRNLLAGNLRKSAGIMRFGNGLPRQSADWLAMTGFFDRLTTRRKSRGFVVSGKSEFGMPAAPSRDRSVKLASADNTWLETAREDRWLPDL